MSRPTESAILAGLRWLARHQDSQGGWSDSGLNCGCEAGSGELDEATTSLVLEAFEAAGYSLSSFEIYVDPVKPEVDLPFSEVIALGLAYLQKVYGRDPSQKLRGHRPVPVDETPILASQKTAAHGCSNGSWDPEDESRVVTTAINTLRLIALRKR